MRHILTWSHFAIGRGYEELKITLCLLPFFSFYYNCSFLVRCQFANLIYMLPMIFIGFSSTIITEAYVTPLSATANI